MHASKLLQSCLTLWPVDCSPPGSVCPWDSPGKNTGVGCHALLQGSSPHRDGTRVSYVTCIGRQVLHHHHYLFDSEVAQSCLTVCDPMDCSLSGFSVHGIFQARILGVGCHFLLQGIFPNQGLNPGLPQTDCLPSEPPGKPLLMISPFWWFPINTEALLCYYNVETQEGASDTEKMLPRRTRDEPGLRSLTFSILIDYHRRR